MTDNMPEKIYVRRTTAKGLSAVRPESPLAVTQYPNHVSEKLNRTSYTRTDIAKAEIERLKAELTKLKCRFGLESKTLDGAKTKLYYSNQTEKTNDG